ncbi:hypothetical protein L7F22_044340 [Adiantum nelumboides]|nr:hypothetical protein [Adiantum nelumboides]
MEKENRTTLSNKEYEMSESLLDMASVKQEAKKALEVTEQQYGPDAISYASSLQRCIENRDFAEGKRLHFSVVINGLDYDSSFGAPLIRMYSFFQKLTEAQQVFSKLVEPNLFSWSAIMSAYGKFGQTEEVFKLYTQLQNSTVRLDGHGFVAVLQACSISSDLQWGRVIHNHVIESGWELDVFVGSTIIDMYSNCGHVADAHAVFNRLPSGNLVTWSALMKGYSQLDSTEEVLQLFAKMQQQGMNPDEVTFIGILKACTGAVFKDAQHIHANIVKGGFEPNLWVSNALIDFYTRCNDLAAARIVFNKMPDQSPVAYSTLMAGYIQSNDGHQALQLYQHCHKNLAEPDLITFVCTLKACTSLSDIDFGQQIHADIIESGFEANVAIGSIVIDLYIKCGDLVNAHRHFLRLPARNIVTWNALITGYSQQEYCEKVFQYFDQLQGEGLSPDSVTFGYILKACSSTGSLEGCRRAHMDIVERGLDMENSISNLLIDMYAKQGSIADARILFGSSPNRDVVAWSSLIGGFIQHGNCQDAFQLFERMQVEGSKPDPVAYACILKACCSSNELDKGRRLNCEVVRGGWESDMFLGNTLIDMYTKCGSLEDACRVFCKLEDRSVVTWSSLISGYIQHDNSEEALRLFRRMQVEGVDLNLVTCICCLKACSNVAALEQGRHIHRCLVDKGYEMDVMAGSTLISMYAKCGSLSDAQTLFGRLVQRNTVTWSALLSGYAQHNEYYSALECFREMEREGFRPDNIAFLCLLSACSHHPDLVEQGCLHFKSMLNEYLLQPTVEHFNSLIDMFGHANYLNKAEDLIETIPFEKNSTGWTSLLSASKSHGNLNLGKRCFDQLVRMDPENTASYVLMAGIYGKAGMLEDARKLEEMRRRTNGWKKPAKAFIEVDGEVHGFVVGDQAHPRSFDIYTKLVTLDTQMKKEGYQPCASMVINPVDEKETIVCGHAEKLAIAFGLLSTYQGTTIRVSKNLRMCSDCHSAAKYISQSEMREILVSDTHCVHHFLGGECSCD